jgi:mRNA-degrading endonuclease toxin of MazEF toxin-antitoxin module
LIEADAANGLTKNSKILLNRLRAIDKKLRLRDYCGTANKEVMDKVKRALTIILNFDDRLEDN